MPSHAEVGQGTGECACYLITSLREASGGSKRSPALGIPGMGESSDTLLNSRSEAEISMVSPEFQGGEGE